MCPRCKQTYKLISGLIQHIESEICGLALFEQVEDMSEVLDRINESGGEAE
jgi:hypothetical protein